MGVERLANTLSQGSVDENKEESKEDNPAASVKVKTGPTPEEVAAEKKRKEKQEAERKEAEKKAALARIKLQGETSLKSKAIASSLKRSVFLLASANPSDGMISIFGFNIFSDPYRHINGKEPEQSSHKTSTYFKLQPPAYNVACSRNLCANNQ